MSEFVRIGNRDDKYAVISNKLLQDKSITWEARGVMAYLISRDIDTVDIDDLIEHSPESKDYASINIDQIIKELERNDYIDYFVKNGDKDG